MDLISIVFIEKIYNINRNINKYMYNFKIIFIFIIYRCLGLIFWGIVFLGFFVYI